MVMMKGTGFGWSLIIYSNSVMWVTGPIKKLWFWTKHNSLKTYGKEKIQIVLFEIWNLLSNCSPEDSFIQINLSTTVKDQCSTYSDWQNHWTKQLQPHKPFWNQLFFSCRKGLSTMYKWMNVPNKRSWNVQHWNNECSSQFSWVAHLNRRD